LGQKVHPKGMRLGIIRGWDARWFAGKEFTSLLHEDIRVRAFVKKRLLDSGVALIELERAANRLKVTVHTAKPGMVIGRGGTEVERLRQDLERMTGRQVSVNIVEVRSPELSAQLVAEGVAAQLQRRISFRRAIKQAAQRTMRAGAQGVKIMVSGRLGGAELSRTEWTAEGSVPLHTLRADIDYGFAEAFTTYGQIGVKCWIYRGEVLPAAARQGSAPVPAAQPASPADAATGA
jgi:small subunit ribosomal protein S3